MRPPCFPEYLLHRADPVLAALSKLTDAYKTYADNSDGKIYMYTFTWDITVHSVYVQTLVG